jgi:hypothetical protein
VRDRREQRGAQAFRFGQQPRLIDVGDELGPLDRDRDLVDQRFQQVALLRRQLPLRVLERDAEQTDQPASGLEGKEQPFRSRQRARAPPGRLAAFPANCPNRSNRPTCPFRAVLGLSLAPFSGATLGPARCLSRALHPAALAQNPRASGQSSRRQHRPPGRGRHVARRGPGRRPRPPDGQLRVSIPKH